MTYLVLSGGGTRGVLTHAGAVQYLLDRGVHIHGLAGTSAGALVAYATALGLSPAEVALDLLGRKEIAHRSPKFYRGYPCLYSSDRILAELRALGSGREFIRELVIYTSNLATRREHVWCSSRHVHAPWPWVALASMSIPVVFQPIRIHGHDHVDGGLTSNFAVDAFAPAHTVGLYIEGPGQKARNPRGLRSYLSAIVDVAINANVREDIDDQDVADIYRLKSQGSSLRFDYSIPEAQAIIDHGYDQMERKWAK